MPSVEDDEEEDNIEVNSRPNSNVDPNESGEEVHLCDVHPTAATTAITLLDETQEIPSFTHRNADTDQGSNEANKSFLSLKTSDSN